MACVRLFQRTVTGVFNSIKTAVGAEGEGPAPRPLHDWTYVCTSIELSVSISSLDRYNVDTKK